MGVFIEFCKKHNEGNSGVFNLFLDSYNAFKKELNEIEELMLKNYDQLLKSGAENAEYLLRTNFEDLINKHDQIEDLLSDCSYMIWGKKKIDRGQINIFDVGQKKKE